MTNEDGLLPVWLAEHRVATNLSTANTLTFRATSRRPGSALTPPSDPLLSDQAFNRHSMNDGSHVSPYDNAMVQVGLDGLEVRLLQGINEESFKRVVSRATRATTGLPAPQPGELADEDWEEMMGGGLQSALESQVIVFEVWGASRALTHQLVRTRKAGFHQQSQRATWYGDHPEVRMPESIWKSTSGVRQAWLDAVHASWRAYRMACEADVSYQDARYILTEGTTNYIQCEYSLREFINVFAYRGCSMFLWEMVACMRKMRGELLNAHPMFEPYVKISCEKGPEADRKCTFQGWENVEGQCDLPWAKQSNRTFLPSPKYRIGSS